MAVTAGAGIRGALHAERKLLSRTRAMGLMAPGGNMRLDDVNRLW